MSDILLRKASGFISKKVAKEISKRLKPDRESMQASINQADIPSLRCHLNTQKPASCDITFQYARCSLNLHDVKD
jgi:hypothetical protein